MSFIEPDYTKNHADCRCWMCSTFWVVNAEGREFAVRTVVKGEQYGRNGCLIWESDDPCVEFYDASYKGGDFDPFGQFTGGRYYASTLRKRREGTGLALDGNEPVWTIDGDTMRDVMEHPYITVLS